MIPFFTPSPETTREIHRLREMDAAYTAMLDAAGKRDGSFEAARDRFYKVQERAW